MKQSQNGISKLSVILMCFLVLVLGIGGYFCYTKVIVSQGSVPIIISKTDSGLIPDELKAYAIGKNADAFFIYKKDAELDNQLKLLPTEALVANTVKSALFLAEAKSQSVVIVIEFESEKDATLAKTFFESGLQKKDIPKELELNKNILRVGYGSGKSVFQGDLLDNPHVSVLDKEKLNSQLIGYINFADMQELAFQVQELTPLTSFNNSVDKATPIKVAHAQSGFLSSNPDNSFDSKEITSKDIASENIANYMSDAYMYIKVINGQLSVQASFNIADKAELAELPIGKHGLQVGINKDELEKNYEKAIKQFEQSIPELNKSALVIKDRLPSLDIKISIEGLVVSIEAQAPIKDLTEQVNSQYKTLKEGAVFARDASRKAGLNNIIVALEQYKAINGEYPSISNCVDKMDEIKEYFKNETSPIDVSGKQNFGEIQCDSGYYYQYVPNHGNLVWAVMEHNNDGNTDLKPDELVKQLEQGINPVKKQQGNFFFLETLQETSANNGINADSSSGNGTNVKVRRKT